VLTIRLADHKRRGRHLLGRWGSRSLTMGQKVGQAMGLEVLAWVGHLSHVVGFIFSRAPRSTVDYCSFFPPTANSALALFRSNAASRDQHLSALEGVVRYSWQGLCSYFLPEFLVADSHGLGTSRRSEEEMRVSVACASRRGTMLPSPAGILQAVGFVKKRGTT
jgi:hypothetical protein